jgi:hypothetical protein
MLKGRLLVAPHSCHYNTIQYNDISLTNIWVHDLSHNCKTESWLQNRFALRFEGWG